LILCANSQAGATTGPFTSAVRHLLRRLRCCPQRGTNLVAAVLTLESATRT
jgi:hypothetical protein